MFKLNGTFKPRLRISHSHGALVAEISRHNQWRFYRFFLFCCTTVFAFFGSIFVKGFSRMHSALDSLYVLPFMGFVLLWYLLAVRIGLWRGFGSEEIVIRQGMIDWRRNAWRWHRRFEAPIEKISNVEAKMPWHSLSNHVEFTCAGKTYAVGDMLLSDEAKHLASELRRAIGLH